MGFLKCERGPPGDVPKTFNYKYKDIFFTCGPYHSSFYNNEEKQLPIKTQINAKLQSTFSHFLSSIMVFELSDAGYYHIHVGCFLSDRSTKWLTMASHLKVILNSMPTPDSTQAINCRADHCYKPEGRTSEEIMISYVTTSSKGKELSSVVHTHQDLCGPTPQHPGKECSHFEWFYYTYMRDQYLFRRQVLHTRMKRLKHNYRNCPDRDWVEKRLQIAQDARDKIASHWTGPPLFLDFWPFATDHEKKFLGKPYMRFPPEDN